MCGIGSASPREDYSLSGTKDDMPHIIARLNVIEHIMRMLFRVVADKQVGPEHVLELAEQIKTSIEASGRLSETTSYQTAAVDKFFNALAADLRRDLEQDP